MQWLRYQTMNWETMKATRVTLGQSLTYRLGKQAIVNQFWNLVQITCPGSCQKSTLRQTYTNMLEEKKICRDISLNYHPTGELEWLANWKNIFFFHKRNIFCNPSFGIPFTGFKTQEVFGLGTYTNTDYFHLFYILKSSH